jgi:hypothetical protein
MLEPRELLETIMIDFGLDPAGRSKPLLLRDLSQYPRRSAARRPLVLLVIDEAQNLGLGSLEELRMLSNLETEKSKLLQIVLVGQPNLRDKLAAPELEQLRSGSRSAITCRRSTPTRRHYINHRLRRARSATPIEFPREATDLIHARSRGVPRIINVICDAALVFGYAEERRTFDAATIAECSRARDDGRAAARSDADDGRRSPSRAPAAAGAASRRAAAAGGWPRPSRRAAAGAVQRRAAPRSARRSTARAALRSASGAGRAARVLAEEYRLLRAAAAGGAAPAVPAVRTSCPQSRRGPTHAAKLLGRVKRIMLGVSAS